MLIITRRFATGMQENRVGEAGQCRDVKRDLAKESPRCACAKRTKPGGARVVREHAHRRIGSKDLSTRATSASFSRSAAITSTFVPWALIAWPRGLKATGPTGDEDEIITATGETVGIHCADTRGCAGDNGCFLVNWNLTSRTTFNVDYSTI